MALSNTEKIVDVQSVEEFKAWLDKALDSLMWWKISLPTTEGLELDDL